MDNQERSGAEVLPTAHFLNQWLVGNKTLGIQNRTSERAPQEEYCGSNREARRFPHCRSRPRQTLPGITVGTYYALSTLTDILPDQMANNIASVPTNAPNPPHKNFSADTAPDIRKDAPQFLLDNPSRSRGSTSGLRMSHK